MLRLEEGQDVGQCRHVLVFGQVTKRLTQVLLMYPRYRTIRLKRVVIALDDDGWNAVELFVRDGCGLESACPGKFHAEVFIEALQR